MKQVESKTSQLEIVFKELTVKEILNSYLLYTFGDKSRSMQFGKNF